MVEWFIFKDIQIQLQMKHTLTFQSEVRVEMDLLVVLMKQLVIMRLGYKQDIFKTLQVLHHQQFTH
jgi:hypothetical protein